MTETHAIYDVRTSKLWKGSVDFIDFQEIFKGLSFTIYPENLYGLDQETSENISFEKAKKIKKNSKSFHGSTIDCRKTIPEKK